MLEIQRIKSIAPLNLNETLAPGWVVLWEVESGLPFSDQLPLYVNLASLSCTTQLIQFDERNGCMKLLGAEEVDGGAALLDAEEFDEGESPPPVSLLVSE